MKKILSVLFATTFLFTSCREEKEIVWIELPELTIENVEIGAENNKKAIQDSEFHLEAEIKAEAGIKSVKVQIVSKTPGYSLFSFEKDFPEFESKISAEIHEHFDVPKRAKVGEYDVFIIVVDKNNQRKVFEDTLNVIVDENLPSVKDNTEIFEASTKTLNIKAKILAPQKIASVHIKVNSFEQTFQDADMVGKTEFNFDKNLDLSSLARGHYHITIKITDEKGSSHSYSGRHFDIR